MWALLGVVSLAAALSFWLFDALPCQDLAAHAGLIALRHRFAESAFEQRYYQLGPFVGPYAVFLTMGELLGRALGPLDAVRTLATLPVLATPAALLFARRKLHGDRTVAAGFFGVALSFGYLTLLGLASYLLGVALLLVAFTLWLELLADVDLDRPAGTRELVFGATALVLSLTHGYAFGLLAILAALTVATGANRKNRALRLRALAPGLALEAWSALYGGAPAGSVGRFELTPSADFQTPIDKLSLLLTPTLMTRTGVDVAVGLTLWGVLLSSFWATLRNAPRPQDELDRRSLSHSRGLGFAAAGTGVLFLVLPHAFKWFGFIDGRLVPVFLFLLVMGVRRSTFRPRLERAFDGVAVTGACIMTGLVLFASARFQTEARGYREVFAAVPAEATLLNLPIDPNSEIFTAHPFVHYDKLIAVERPVLLSDVWADRATALYPTSDNPATRLPEDYSSANLKPVDWSTFDLSRWDFILIRTRPTVSAPAVPPSVVLAVHMGGWWLYRTSRAPAR
jgi:hypothetical protein